MALTTIPAVALVLDTVSADLPDASLTSIASAADGFSITGLNNETRNVIFSALDSGSASVVTINAGANPPSMRAGLGNLTVTLAASDVKHVAIEAARFMQADGTITGTVDTNGTASIGAKIIPRSV
jgi:hypothetical protein